MAKTEKEQDIERYTGLSNLDYYTIEKRATKYYVMVSVPGEEPREYTYSDSLKGA